MTAPAPKGRLGNGQLRRHKDAVRDRRPFSPRTGLPEAEATVGEDPVTWYKQARASTEVKWASLAPASRRPVAEALVTVTVALTARSAARPRARCYGRRCSPGRSTPPLATRSRRRRPPPHLTGRNAPRSGQRAGEPGGGAAGARCLRADPDREGCGRVNPAAQAVGVLQRAQLRHRTGSPRLQPRSTPTASTGRPTPPTSASPMPSASKTPGPAPATKGTKTASRHPETPGQRQETGHDGRHTAHTLAVRARPWPARPQEPGLHGHIADGGSPGRRLERRMRWSAAPTSAMRDGL